VIYGLLAALGWGVADFAGAVGGRRIGSLWVVLIAQTLSTIVVTGFLLFADADLGAVPAVAWAIVVNGAFSALAYVTHYKALELGPVAVVSPVGATYALVGTILAIVFLDERPGALTLLGGVVTVLGVMLASTDLRALRAGTHGMPPGLPWALVSAFGFGVGGFTLATLSQELGWELGLWTSRCAQLVAFAGVGLTQRRQLHAVTWSAVGIWAAVVAGFTDLLGVAAYSLGAEAGDVTPLLIASAVFPVIAVGASVVYLHERPVPNQYVGIATVVVGLLLLGVSQV
jgi:drug/metabolite transporter (DMT)-like permease